MTERSLPWPGTTVGDAGAYSGDQWRLVLKSLGAQLNANEGVLGGILNSLRPTSPGDNQVRIDTGRAIVDGRLYETDVAVTKTITSPTVGTTGKRLVLRKSWAAQTVRITEITSADGTATIPALTQTDLTTWDIPLVSFTITTAGVIGALTEEREFTRPAYITFQHVEAGAVLTPGVKARMEIPADIEIVGWTLLGDVSGTITYDIWVDTYANYPPTVADTITAAAKPNLTAQQKNQGNTVTWPTRKLLRGTTLIINADSTPVIASVTGVTLVLRGFRA